jgi:hypothetical protein
MLLLNQQSPARNAGIKKRKQCQRMPVSGSMNVWLATFCSDPKRAIVAYSAPMVMSPAHRSRKENSAAKGKNRL